MDRNENKGLVSRELLPVMGKPYDRRKVLELGEAEEGLREDSEDA